MVQRFVYVARLKTGDEVGLRRVLEHLPDEAIADAGFEEFSTYVGSGFCVLQFAVPDGDFQVQAERFFNDPRTREFSQKVAGFLIEGQQIAQAFSTGAGRFHQGASRAGAAPFVTSAEMPLAAEVSRWPRT